jgi:hypothetical protein
MNDYDLLDFILYMLIFEDDFPINTKDNQRKQHDNP